MGSAAAVTGVQGGWPAAVAVVIIAWAAFASIATALELRFHTPSMRQAMTAPLAALCVGVMTAFVLQKGRPARPPDGEDPVSGTAVGGDQRVPRTAGFAFVPAALMALVAWLLPLPVLATLEEQRGWIMRRLLWPADLKCAAVVALPLLLLALAAALTTRAVAASGMGQVVPAAAASRRFHRPSALALAVASGCLVLSAAWPPSHAVGAWADEMNPAARAARGLYARLGPMRECKLEAGGTSGVPLALDADGPRFGSIVTVDVAAQARLVRRFVSRCGTALLDDGHIVFEQPGGPRGGASGPMWQAARAAGWSCHLLRVEVPGESYAAVIAGPKTPAWVGGHLWPADCRVSLLELGEGEAVGPAVSGGTISEQP